MRIEWQLFRTDALAIRRWFAFQTVSKFLVILCFLALGLLISLVSYTFSRIFFTNLALYSQYGVLTASYILHAAIVILLWFALGSSIASTVSFFITQTRQLDFLLTQPIVARRIIGWHFIKSSLVNIVLLLFFLLPVMVPYAIAFEGGVTFSFLLRFLYVLFLIVMLINSVGIMVAYFISMILSNRRLFAGIGLALFFILGTVLLLQAIFPPEMYQLYKASPRDFLDIYYQLPLSRSYLPTFWFVRVLVDGFTEYSVYGLLLTGIIFIFSLRYQTGHFFAVCQRVKEQGMMYQSTILSKQASFARSRWPLLKKDLLSITRSSSETGYAFFLVSMAIFFFLFFIKSMANRSYDMPDNTVAVLFSFVWLLFFTTAYLLRLIFPLMAKEGRQRWFFLTIPLSHDHLIESKIASGMLLVIPQIFLAGIIFTLLPFTREHVLAFMIITIYSIVLLALAQGFLGTIYPNFAEGQSPERVSTSVMGIVSLLVSMAIITLMTFGVYFYIKHVFSIWYVMSFATAIGVMMCTVLFLLAHHANAKYVE